ncbi:hypothetical protein BHM03_00042555, partial [Ensete ventricosum]
VLVGLLGDRILPVEPTRLVNFSDLIGRRIQLSGLTAVNKMGCTVVNRRFVPRLADGLVRKKWLSGVRSYLSVLGVKQGSGKGRGIILIKERMGRS